MASIIADTGLVSSWANNTNLISGANAPMSFDLSVEAPALKDTGFVSGGVGAHEFLANIYGWSATIRGRLNPAKLGNTGSVTFSGGYTVRVKNYSIDLNWGAEEDTGMSGSTVAAREFIPGILEWGGEYTCRVDDTTALVLPGASAASLTLKIAEDGANDVTLSGNAFAERLSTNIEVGRIVEAVYAFKGSGDLTSADGSTAYTPFLWADGVIVRPTTGSLVLRAATGRTYTGNAFSERVRITVPVDGIIEIEVTARGSGALAVA